MSPGKTAAAVLIPLLFVILCIDAYIKLKHSTAGANAAIRKAIGVGNRNSSSSFGAIRPSSTIAVEGEDAGAAGVGSQGRQMSQMRTGVGLRSPAAMSSTERVSRISFAPYTHDEGLIFLPFWLFPTMRMKQQVITPRTLSPEDIRSRIAAEKSKNSSQENGNEFSEIMPALSKEAILLSLMTCSCPPLLLLRGISQTRYHHTQAMRSPVMSTMPIQPMPANVMSPDEMLRAYAERKKPMAGHKSITPASISYSVPVANSGTAVPSTNNNMWVLYNAATGNISPTNTGNGSNGTNTEDAPCKYSGAESYLTSMCLDIIRTRPLVLEPMEGMVLCNSVFEVSALQ
ncbi:hypothetical protein BDZ97DRAFT_1762699 [Flammula alnicola]|nr:hypothetical protein BDZ97DRAFT_1762699 [Flammula alnicola]